MGDTNFGFVADFKIWVIELVDNQLEYENENPHPKLKKKLKEDTKKKWWKLN